ncbi:MAG: TauD/TfdA family dioxygenase [Saprospiraceae bacterium]|nr:TauD/TfdA family dioxygenase [Saprospiraceae bacterium]
MNNSLPSIRRGPTVWYGPEMEKRKDLWIQHFSDSEIQELEAAAQHVITNKIEIENLFESSFPLPTIGSKLKLLRGQLISGIGFSILRGLPISTYSEDEMATIFYGIGAHIGNARSQNASGHLLGHVRNMGKDSTDPNVRLYQTSERQTFHTDSCDVVGLLCVQPAKEGGLSLLVSADTVFNEMRKRQPDLCQLLLDPIATDRRGEVPEGMLPYLLIPVFNDYKDHISPFYQRQYIESAQRFGDAPRLTEKHIEALDLFDELCNSPDLHLSMMLQKGDIQFVYNHAMLHDRTGFIDHEEIDKRRHLMRLWLSIPGDRPLPEVFSTRFGSVEIGNRGGIIVPGSKRCIPKMSNIIKEIKRK